MKSSESRENTIEATKSAEIGGRKVRENPAKKNSALRFRQLAQQIERDIHIGRLGAGTWLKQIDLEEKYGASRMDIRHALDRLEEKGLVKLETHRGYRVETFDLERFRNVVTIRSILEAAAAEEVLKHIDTTGLARLEEQARKFANAVSSGTVIEQEDSNRGFHDVMLAYCPNTDLVSMIFDLRNRIPVTVSREKNTATVLARTVNEHFDIVRCLRERDKAGLLTAVHRHALASLENF